MNILHEFLRAPHALSR